MTKRLRVGVTTGATASYRSYRYEITGEADISADDPEMFVPISCDPERRGVRLFGCGEYPYCLWAEDAVFKITQADERGA